jgi:hypothetical protein
VAKTVPPALRALLESVVDYAGMFPPASLDCAAVVANYARYRTGEHAWILRWLVIGAGDLERVPRELDGMLAVLGDTDHARAAVIEAKRIVSAAHPVYCEVDMDQLDDVKRAGCFAKLRTGGVTPQAIPPVPDVAAFLRACAERRLPFKATAGLHHPVRHVHSLTYGADAPRAVMHGFLNVFVAAAFAWHGRREIEPLLGETDAAAFRFDDRAHWRDWSLDAAEVRAARQQSAHSFGSCSFDEPIQGLVELGFL